MAKDELVFEEHQYFRQWWYIVLMLFIDLCFIYCCIVQIGFGKSVGNNPMSDIWLLSITIFLILFTVWFISLRLDVEINKDGIYWRFFLLEYKFHFLSWDDLDSSEVVIYNPLQFGGWGIRTGGVGNFSVKDIHGSFSKKWKISGFGRVKVYSTSGDKALALELTNGKIILIGTKKPEEIVEILTQIHAQRNKK